MNPKKLLFSQEARHKLKKGVDNLVDAVKVTLGPKGRTAVIKKGEPKFTMDGVTVAKSIGFKDDVENMGAELVKSVADKTNREAGDGTSTASILTQSLLDEGLKGVDSGMDAIRIREGMNEAKDFVVDEIKDLKKPIESKQDMKDIATISSRDEEIGEVIANIFDEIGEEGVVAVEESKSIGLESEIVEGIEINEGFVSQHFINTEKNSCEIENPYILVTDQNVSSNQDLMRILESVVDTSEKSIVVIANEIKGEALATLALNKLQGRFQSLAVKAPGHGEDKENFLRDICLATGAEFISENLGKKVEDVELEDLGRAKKVVSTEDKTTIIEGDSDTDEIEAEIKRIKSELEEEESKRKVEILEKRLARLSSSVAVIRYGAMSQAEQSETHDRIEDAVNAVKSALKEGVVVGGGLALVRTSEKLKEIIDKEDDVDKRFGMEALYNAIRRPAYQVIENTGAKPDVIINKVIENDDIEYGYDASTGEYGNMFEFGVIDPLKVVRTALENAVSVVGLFIVNEVVISDEEIDD